MPLLPLALLLACLAALAWTTRRSLARYAAFKALTETADRQRTFRHWVLRSFAFYGGISIVVLAALGRLGGVLAPPAEFGRLVASVSDALPLREVGPILLGEVVAAMTIGASITAVMAQRGSRRLAPVHVGNIAPLFPRNGAETAWVALLSLNAGVTEELFFRLMLPLLVAQVTGDALTGFVAAGAVFGLAHIYQGWIGVVGTAVIGLIFTGLYLATGSLIAAMTAHVLLDLFGLVVRPTVARAFRRR
jgi:membrane protease YdiL (CAAX protease family)